MAKVFLVLFTIINFLTTTAWSYDRTNRMGLGFSNELETSSPGISFKLQKTRSLSVGAILSASTHPQSGNFGAGLKLYRNLFDEPQLNFYLTGLGAFINNKIYSVSYTGFQFDIGFGSEWHFTGLNSLGFSMEFGLSAYKLDQFNFQTKASPVGISAIHFYL